MARVPNLSNLCNKVQSIATKRAAAHEKAGLKAGKTGAADEKALAKCLEMDASFDAAMEALRSGIEGVTGLMLVRPANNEGE